MVDSLSITDSERDGWQRLIDQRLLVWLRDPSLLEDDGIDAPERSLLRFALDVAENYRDSGWPAPHKIVPDPNGGVIFERAESDTVEAIYIWDDFSIEYLQYEKSRLVERQKLSPEAEQNVSLSMRADTCAT